MTTSIELWGERRQMPMGIPCTGCQRVMTIDVTSEAQADAAVNKHAEDCPGRLVPAYKARYEDGYAAGFAAGFEAGRKAAS